MVWRPPLLAPLEVTLKFRFRFCSPTTAPNRFVTGRTCPSSPRQLPGQPLPILRPEHFVLQVRTNPRLTDTFGVGSTAAVHTNRYRKHSPQSVLRRSDEDRIIL